MPGANFAVARHDVIGVQFCQFLQRLDPGKRFGVLQVNRHFVSNIIRRKKLPFPPARKPPADKGMARQIHDFKRMVAEVNVISSLQ